jgi:periplasmic divalent cation tolerance protein
MSGKNTEASVAEGRAEAECKTTHAPCDGRAVLIYTTFPSHGEAEKAGRFLVENKLAACVNIFPGMIAIFPWEGKTDRATEAAMIVKTAKSRADEALAAIKSLHPYALPARLVLPVAGGGADFLDWIEAETAPAPGNP